MDVSSDFADVNGVRLYFERAGSGQPVVLLHAGIAHSGMWDAQFAVLSQRWSVLRYDMRGYGRSLMPVGNYSHSADLDALLDALGIASAHLVGCSQGGRVALEFALEHPDRVRSLVVSGATLWGYEFSELVTEYARDNDEAFARGDIATAVELDMRMWVVGPKRRPDQLDAAFLERARAMATDVYKTPPTFGDELPLEPPALNRLWQIKAPTLVVVGGYDVPDILTIGGMLAFALDKAEKQLVPEAGHLLPMEQPAAFNALVHDFLARHF